MTATALLAELRQRGVILNAVDGRLRVDAPKGCLDTELRKALAAHKHELLELLASRRVDVGQGLPSVSAPPLGVVAPEVVARTSIAETESGAVDESAVFATVFREFRGAQVIDEHPMPSLPSDTKYAIGFAYGDARDGRPNGSWVVVKELTGDTFSTEGAVDAERSRQSVAAVVGATNSRPSPQRSGGNRGPIAPCAKRTVKESTPVQRARALYWARCRGWPALKRSGSGTVIDGEPAWRDFVRNASAAELEAAVGASHGR